MVHSTLCNLYCVENATHTRYAKHTRFVEQTLATQNIPKIQRQVVEPASTQHVAHSTQHGNVQHILASQDIRRTYETATYWFELASIAHFCGSAEFTGSIAIVVLILNKAKRAVKRCIDKQTRVLTRPDQRRPGNQQSTSVSQDCETPRSLNSVCVTRSECVFGECV